VIYIFDPPKSGHIVVIGPGVCSFCHWYTPNESQHVHDIDPEEYA
jgi:hypothetical protein